MRAPGVGSVDPAAQLGVVPAHRLDDLEADRDPLGRLCRAALRAWPRRSGCGALVLGEQLLGEADDLVDVALRSAALAFSITPLSSEYSLPDSTSSVARSSRSRFLHLLRLRVGADPGLGSRASRTRARSRAASRRGRWLRRSSRARSSRKRATSSSLSLIWSRLLAMAFSRGRAAGASRRRRRAPRAPRGSTGLVWPVRQPSIMSS